MTGSVRVVVIVAGGGGGLASVVGGMGIGANYTPSELVLLGKQTLPERTIRLFDGMYTMKIFVLSVYLTNQSFLALG